MQSRSRARPSPRREPAEGVRWTPGDRAPVIFSRLMDSREDTPQKAGMLGGIDGLAQRLLAAIQVLRGIDVQRSEQGMSCRQVVAGQAEVSLSKPLFQFAQVPPCCREVTAFCCCGASQAAQKL